MIPAYLIKLHTILSDMVSEERLTRTERNQILSKAGLTYLGNEKWQDERGAIYTLGR